MNRTEEVKAIVTLQFKKRILREAKKQNRSVSNFIENALGEYMDHLNNTTNQCNILPIRIITDMD